jgi:ferredoxin
VDQLFIDPVECIDCGACVPVCPVSAIFALDDLPEKWHSYIEKNANYVTGGKFRRIRTRRRKTHPRLLGSSLRVALGCL